MASSRDYRPDEAKRMEGIDKGFAFSDHQPLRGAFRYRP
jgi:hypothetical protein